MPKIRRPTLLSINNLPTNNIYLSQPTTWHSSQILLSWLATSVPRKPVTSHLEVQCLGTTCIETNRPPRIHKEFPCLLTPLLSSTPSPHYTSIWHINPLPLNHYPMSYYPHTNRQQLTGHGEKL